MRALGGMWGPRAPAQSQISRAASRRRQPQPGPPPPPPLPRPPPLAARPRALTGSRWHAGGAAVVGGCRFDARGAAMPGARAGARDAEAEGVAERRPPGPVTAGRVARGDGGEEGARPGTTGPRATSRRKPGSCARRTGAWCAAAAARPLMDCPAAWWTAALFTSRDFRCSIPASAGQGNPRKLSAWYVWLGWAGAPAHRAVHLHVHRPGQPGLCGADTEAGTRVIWHRTIRARRWCGA